MSIEGEKPPQRVLVDDASILNIDFEKQIPAIIKISLLQSLNLDQDQTAPKQESYIKGLKNKLNTTINGEAVIGNLTETLEIGILVNNNNDTINKPYINELQYPIDLSESQIQDLKNQIIKLKNDYIDWDFIFSHLDLYKELEAQLRKDIENNTHELVIIGHTIIVSKHFTEYNQIKDQIPSEKVTECFKYHGTKLINHSKIAKTHFLMPYEGPKDRLLDPHIFGQGIATVDDVLYASYYSNEVHPLKVNEKTYVICCRSIYNKDKEKDVSEKGKFSYLGQKIEGDIKENFGVHRVLVGSSKSFLPIEIDEIDKNEIYGNEFIFPNKYQVIPCLSFTVLRKDHYILYNDENLNMNEILKNVVVNVYRKCNVDDAVDLVRKKKFAAVKLILNDGSRDLILRCREIIGSNFVCLVFSKNENNVNWISEMENVLLTTDYEDVKKFASLKMNVNDLLAFVQEIKNKYEKNNFNFKINERELLLFPNCMEIDPYYKSYYNNNDSNNDGIVKTLFKKIFSFFG